MLPRHDRGKCEDNKGFSKKLLARVSSKFVIEAFGKSFTKKLVILLTSRFESVCAFNGFLECEFLDFESFLAWVRFSCAPSERLLEKPLPKGSPEENSLRVPNPIESANSLELPLSGITNLGQTPREFH